MSRQEVREQQMGEWLEHLRSCEAAGSSLAEYARQQGIAEWKLYQWRRRLVSDGRWPAKTPAATPTSQRKLVPMRFARIAVTPPAPVYIVRLQLGNGRRVEIEMANIDPLVDLIGALEGQP